MKMTNGATENNENTRQLHSFNILANILLLIVSLLSVIADLFIGLLLIVQYYKQGQTSWAIVTFSIVFFPSIIMQILSIKFYLDNNSMTVFQWFLHSILFGVIHRYIRAITKCIRGYKPQEGFQLELIMTDINNIKNLYLFKSFLECGPQLVFQLYIFVVADNKLPITMFSALTSTFSIAWALLIHTNVKKEIIWSGLVLLVFWRIGMVSARMSALVLCLHTCSAWIILFVGSHWLAMTLWITYQRSAQNEKKKNGEFHSSLYGVIYCFCFFSLKLGQFKSSATVLNLLLLFENLTFLTVFLMRSAARSHSFPILAFIVVTGSIIGVTSFVLYNFFFRSNATEICGRSSQRMQARVSKKRLFRGKINLYNLKHKEGNQSAHSPQVSKCENEEKHDVQSPSDSIIIIEETPVAEDEPNNAAVPVPSDTAENIYDEPIPEGNVEELDGAKLSAALKRRAICSSVDLTKFVDKKNDEIETESSKSSKALNIDDAPSEILSAHDYENLCAVNIAREPWGIRSWRVYSDIETWRHDDSVFNERKLDNMTTSSEYSGKAEDKDSLTIAEEDLIHCDVETTSDKTSVSFFPPLPVSMLDTIFEEREVSSSETDVEDTKPKCNSESTLVATIDKICLYTPLRTRSESIANCCDNPQLERIPKENDGNRVMRKLQVDADRKNCVSPIRERICSVPKLTFFKEKFEINRYQVCAKNLNPSVKTGGMATGNFAGESNLSNIGKIENGRTKPHFNIKERSTSFVQMLTPSKMEKRSFCISPKR